MTARRERKVFNENKRRTIQEFTKVIGRVSMGKSNQLEGGKKVLWGKGEKEKDHEDNKKGDKKANDGSSAFRPCRTWKMSQIKGRGGGNVLNKKPRERPNKAKRHQTFEQLQRQGKWGKKKWVRRYETKIEGGNREKKRQTELCTKKHRPGHGGGGGDSRKEEGRRRNEMKQEGRGGERGPR